MFDGIIDKDSWETILLVWGICAALIFVAVKFIRPKFVKWPLTAVLFVFACFVTWFFRVPDRTIPEVGNDCIVTSVADGEVVIVGKMYEGEYLKRECIQVSVYMDFFDVHCNFWPVSGEVSYYQYHPGKHVMAFVPKCSEVNEHTSTCILTPQGKEVFFKQIAGTFARRIVGYGETQTEAVRGEQCGVIKFGSRIDMFLPIDADVKVKVGDRVTAVESVIAEF